MLAAGLLVPAQAAGIAMVQPVSVLGGQRWVGAEDMALATQAGGLWL